MQIIVGWLVSAGLNWLEKFFADHLAAYERDQANKAASQSQAVQDTAKAAAINQDSTKEEVSAAIDDELSHF